MHFLETNKQPNHKKEKTNIKLNPDLATNKRRFKTVKGNDRRMKLKGQKNKPTGKGGSVTPTTDQGSVHVNKQILQRSAVIPDALNVDCIYIYKQPLAQDVSVCDLPTESSFLPEINTL